MTVGQLQPTARAVARRDPRTRRPRVDVGVVTWNTAELTTRALRHLVDVDQGCDLRILVHDNASDDGTPALLAARVPEVEVVRGTSNVGFARAVNLLIERSDAEWFFLLNSDAWPEQGAVGALVAAGRRHPGAAAVAPLLLRPDGRVEHSTHPFPSVGLAALEAAVGRRWMARRFLEARCLEGAWSHDRPRAVDWAVGAALLLRRAALDDVGGLDERFFMYVEDLEWCWRAHRHGWEVRFEPAAVVRHVGNVSGARRFGEGRLALEAANLASFTSEALGPRRAALYRGLQALACARQHVAARRRGDVAAASYWRTACKANLGLLRPPLAPATPAAATGPVGPEAAGHRGIRVAVAVATHGRADRLERLLDALERQRLPADAFEVVVVDDASRDDTPAVLARVAARTALQLRVIRQPVRRGPAAARNVAWRATTAPVVAFTDDDCVPDPAWLERGLAAVEAGAGVVVGRTAPPADQLLLATQPFARVMAVDGARFYETCNVFYRRWCLEAVGGFDERFRRPSGEDTHLGLAVADVGVPVVYEPAALVLHDVRPGSLRAALRETTRWTDLPLVVKGRPYARGELLHRWVFWKPTHPPAILAATAVVVGARWRPGLALGLPWLAHRLCRTPPCPGRLRRVAALPGALALDLLEVAVMARGSLRHRTVLL